MSRLTRKEMKRDEILESLGRSVSYVRDHTQGLLGLVAGIVVVALLVALFFGYQSRRSELANRLLAEALRIHAAPIDAVNPRPDDAQDPAFADQAGRNARAQAAFERVHSEAEGRPLGGVAAAYLGDLAAAAGDLDRAEELWREAIEDSEDTLLAGRIQISLINLIKERSGQDAAIEQIRGLMSSGSATLPEDVILFELGKALEEAGRADEARSTYDRLVEEHSASVYASEARQKLESL
ncbi:MAG: tol-pal system YbgF family protein [Thermoanaerobaculia bacterium]